MLHLGLIQSWEFPGEPQAVFAFLVAGVRRQEPWAVPWVLGGGPDALVCL